MALAKAEQTHEPQGILVEHQLVLGSGNAVASDEEAVLPQSLALALWLWLAENHALNQLHAAPNVVGRVEVATHERADSGRDVALDSERSADCVLLLE